MLYEVITGSVYIRLQRKSAPILYGEGESFAFGRSKVLRDGSYNFV